MSRSPSFNTYKVELKLKWALYIKNILNES